MSLEARIQVALGGLALDVELELADGEVVALLGPNGAGKTTLVRALAGLAPLTAGRVTLDGRALEDTEQRLRVPTEERPVGVVFQDLLLFPHLSALENVAFGLRCRGAGRREAVAAARQWLRRMGLEARAGARPAALSGGEAQRVALARALAPRPRLLLLDEPLSALDASTRAEVRRDLRRHLASFQGVRLLITHDPLEAIALADRLVVLEAGSIVQSGTPAQVTARPRSRYVADLVGVNLLRGTATGTRVELEGGGVLATAEPAQGSVFAVVHPRAVSLHRRRPEGTPRNVWPGRVAELDLEGDRVRVRVGGQVPLVAEVTPGAVAELALADAGEVWLAVKATEVSVYSA